MKTSTSKISIFASSAESVGSFVTKNTYPVVFIDILH